MWKLFLIGIGGFTGAICRFLISIICNSIVNFPFGTLVVNFLGCLIIGFLGFSIFGISQEFKSLVVIGFIGAFTTMSAFAYETVFLFENGMIFFSLLNFFANNILCILAIYLGKYVANLI